MLDICRTPKINLDTFGLDGRPKRKRNTAKNVTIFYHIHLNILIFITFPYSEKFFQLSTTNSQHFSKFYRLQRKSTPFLQALVICGPYIFVGIQHLKIPFTPLDLTWGLGRNRCGMKHKRPSTFSGTVVLRLPAKVQNSDKSGGISAWERTRRRRDERKHFLWSHSHQRHSHIKPTFHHCSNIHSIQTGSDRQQGVKSAHCSGQNIYKLK